MTTITIDLTVMTTKAFEDVSCIEFLIHKDISKETVARLGTLLNVPQHVEADDIQILTYAGEPGDGSPKCGGTK